MERIVEKLDRYLEQKDFAAAERHLSYWLSEAEAAGDRRGKLALLNEQIGFYRKAEKKTEALAAAEAARALVDALALADTVSGATTLVNAATAYKAFDRAAEALPLYEKAKMSYERDLPKGDARLGSLYNNMALALCVCERYGEAREMLRKALSVMAQAEDGEREMAISCCNLADLAAAEKGLTAAEAEIGEALERAMELLRSPQLAHDGYDAFVCEKCAPTFGYYGFFLYEDELLTRARKFYEGT